MKPLNRRPASRSVWLGTFGTVALASCFAQVPAHVDADASMGLAPSDFSRDIACRDWQLATEDMAAFEHTSFPELSPKGCFVNVRYAEGRVHADPIPKGCGYPEEDAVAALETRAATYEVAASSWSSLARVPLDLACPLPAAVRRAAALQNARTLRSLAAAWSSEAPLRRYPYAVVGAFGYGESNQDHSVIANWRPGDACIPMKKTDFSLLGVNVARASRAAEAYEAGVAPLVTVSGGAVHSSVYEAFFLTHVLSCNLGVPADRILVDPCADHTQTNVRDTGSFVVSVAGRFGYLVTDSGTQSGYLQDWSLFDLVGGAVDQRALRDFGYSIGSWRQVSVGMNDGFWFTPFRFWAAPREGLGSFTCLGDVPRP